MLMSIYYIINKQKSYFKYISFTYTDCYIAINLLYYYSTNTKKSSNNFTRRDLSQYKSRL